jgi:hypothetical protein
MHCEFGHSSAVSFRNAGAFRFFAHVLRIASVKQTRTSEHLPTRFQQAEAAHHCATSRSSDETLQQKCGCECSKTSHNREEQNQYIGRNLE